jgi:hypothetical protein
MLDHLAVATCSVRRPALYSLTLTRCALLRCFCGYYCCCCYTCRLCSKDWCSIYYSAVYWYQYCTRQSAYGISCCNSDSTASSRWLLCTLLWCKVAAAVTFPVVVLNSRLSHFHRACVLCYTSTFRHYFKFFLHEQHTTFQIPRTIRDTDEP